MALPRKPPPAKPPPRKPPPPPNPPPPKPPPRNPPPPPKPPRASALSVRRGANSSAETVRTMRRFMRTSLDCRAMFGAGGAGRNCPHVYFDIRRGRPEMIERCEATESLAWRGAPISLAGREHLLDRLHDRSSWVHNTEVPHLLHV